MLKYGIIVFITLFNSTIAFGQEERLPAYTDLRINLPSGDRYFQFVANETSQTAPLVQAEIPVEPEYKARWFTANKVHQYLGNGSLAMLSWRV